MPVMQEIWKKSQINIVNLVKKYSKQALSGKTRTWYYALFL